MKRSLVLLAAAVLVLAGPLAALDFEPPAGREFVLFESELVDDPRSDGDPRPSGGKRVLEHWYSRGFGVSLVATGALVFPGAGIGLELAVPVDPNVSLTLRGGVIGSIFFEGGYVDAGVRGYVDLGQRFSLYGGLGFRVVTGRVLDYIGGNLKDPLYRNGFGGYNDLGFEVGSHRVRFFLEVGLNGVRLFNTDYQIGFFCGLNFGLRVYIGG